LSLAQTNTSKMVTP